MKCSSCEKENPVEAQFCMGCGTSLKINCLNCQQELPGDAEFCFKCGTQIGKKSKSPQEELIEQYLPTALLDKIKSAEKTGGLQNERRIVTMLFCDLEGSTAAAEQLDPEEWTEIMNGAFKFLIQPVYKYEGVIARLMGDAILAFFGAPVSHEDDPERAVLTALEILSSIKPYLLKVKQEHGLDINVRIGINTGLVVVGEIGSDMRVEYSAMGDAINIASRMESTAEPGTIQITEFTYKPIAPLFEFENLGPMDVKGKSHPINTYRVLQRKDERVNLRGLEGLTSPLIGRDDQFDVILESVNNLMNKKSDIIGILGEAGLGKSRLIREVKSQLESKGRIMQDSSSGLQYFSGASLSYQTTTPLAPFIDLLKKYFDLNIHKTDLAKYSAIVEKLSSINNSDTIAPFIAYLLGVEVQGDDVDRIKYLDPPSLKGKINSSIISLFVTISKIQPILIVLDDIHWADPSSIDLIKSLTEIQHTQAILLILLFRPRKNDISWSLHEFLIREHGHDYKYFELSALSTDEARFLVFNLLRIEGLTLEVRDLILKKAEGNPFFIEEVIRSLIDQNLIKYENGQWSVLKEFQDIDIPDTLAGVLTTRLDRLDEESRHIAQIASVIGREFSFNLLQKIYEGKSNLDDILKSLQKRELIYQRSHSEERTYAFQHILKQENAYNSLLIKRRVELHSKIAEYYIEVHPENLNEIARHYFSAKNFDLAFDYLIQAGTLASEKYSIQEAVQLFKQAESLLNDERDVMKIHDLYNGLGNAYLFSGAPDKAIASFTTLLEHAEKRNHAECKVNAMNQLGLINILGMGDLESAMTHLKEAEDIAIEENYQIGIAENYMIMCNIETATAQFEKVEEHLKKATQIGEELDETRPLLYGRTHISNTLTYIARFKDAIEYAQETIKLCIERGDKGFHAELLSFSLPLSHFYMGKIDEGRQFAKEGVELSIEIGYNFALIFAATSYADIEIMTGNFDNASEYIELAVELSRNLPLPGFLANSLTCGVIIQMNIGSEMESIENEFEQIFEIMNHPTGGFLSAKTYYAYGNLQMQKGDFAGAKTSLNKVIDDVTTLMIIYKPWALLSLAEIELIEDNLETAEEFLKKASEDGSGKEMNLILPFCKVIESKIYWKKGDQKNAIDILEKALNEANEMKILPTVISISNLLIDYLIVSDSPNAVEKYKNIANDAINQIKSGFNNQENLIKYQEFNQANYPNLIK